MMDEDHAASAPIRPSETGEGAPAIADAANSAFIVDSEPHNAELQKDAPSRVVCRAAEPQGRPEEQPAHGDNNNANRHWRVPAVAGALLLLLLGIAVTGALLWNRKEAGKKVAGTTTASHGPRFAGTAADAAGTARILVQLKQGVDIEEAMAAMQEQASSIFVSQRGSVAVVEVATDSEAALEGLERLEASGAVQAVEEDQWLYLEDSERADPDLILSAGDFHSLQAEAVSSSRVPNDSGYEFQWNLQSLGLVTDTWPPTGAPPAWQVSVGSPEIKVCVIDSGVDYTHPDLLGNMWTNPGEIPGNGKDDDGNGFVDDVHGYNFADDSGDPMDSGSNGHGTHVAGIIGATGNNGRGVSGVAQKVSIIACKFLTDNGRGLISDAVRCMDYCQQMGAHITTSSAGDPSFSSTFRAAILEATDDLLYVCSAGNDATNADVVGHYPSGFAGVPNMLTVAALNEGGELSDYSNWGSVTIDIAAPGDDIWSTFPGNRYTSLRGSSMAVPHISGAAALLLSLDRSLKPAGIKKILLESAAPSALLSTKVASGGSLHIGRAMAAGAGSLAESFARGVAFDLAYTAIHFSQVPETSGWIPCRAKDIFALPVNPQGGLSLNVPPKTRAIEANLPRTFRIGGKRFGSVQVHANGVITFGETLDPIGSPSLWGVAERLQLLPLWTSLEWDRQSEVSVKRTTGKTAVTFSRMALGSGRATFQAVLHDNGDVTMAWLDIPSLAAQNQPIVVGISSSTVASPPPSSDFSSSLPCAAAKLVPQGGPHPPLVQFFRAWQPFSLVNRTICYFRGGRDSRGDPPRGCVRPYASPELPIHPAGGLRVLKELRAADDWLEIELLEDEKIKSFADGKGVSRIYVTGRGEISFTKPIPRTGSLIGSVFGTSASLSQESHQLLQVLTDSAQIAVLSSNGWERAGGLLLDYKQLAESLVVTFYKGPLQRDGSKAEPAVLAQASLSWDGFACVTYPSSLAQRPQAPLPGMELLVGASSGMWPQSDFHWNAEVSGLPACILEQEEVRMPAELFPAGTLLDLENRLLRFKPMDASGVGVCLEKEAIDEFPFDPRDGERVDFGNAFVKKVDLEWTNRNFEQAAKFPMLGRDYSSIILGANGYLSFDSSIPDLAVSKIVLHRTRRIAAMFAQLSAARPSTIVSKQQMQDRMVITVADATLRLSAFAKSSNSFQVVLYNDGRIDIAILKADKIANEPRAIGISGGAVPPGWRSSDLSASPTCSPVIAEAFGAGHRFDLEKTSLVLRPKSLLRTSVLARRWRLCYQDLSDDELPVTSRGTQLRLAAQDSIVVDFEDDMVFPFLGTNYRHVHVASNGYLTFDQRQTSNLKGLSDHFAIKRISVFATELDGSTGRVSVAHLRGRVVVTYSNVKLQRDTKRSATFQVELHESGTIVMSWLRCSPRDSSPIVGISSGESELVFWQPLDITDSASERNACPV